MILVWFFGFRFETYTIIECDIFMAFKKGKLRLATITILVRDRKSQSSGVNRILTQNGHLIMARLGVNVQRHCLENCLALIAIMVEGTAKDIAGIAKKLNKLRGIAAKACVM